MLLSRSNYSVVLHPGRLDFQQRMVEFGVHQDVSETSSRPVDTLLVLTRSTDMDVSVLSLGLAARDLSLTRLDADSCDESSVLLDPMADALKVDGRCVRPRICWVRHFDLEAVAVAPDPSHRAYAVNGWHGLRTWLAQNQRWRQLNRGAQTLDRLSQLDAAADEGFRIPKSAVCTRPGDALRILGTTAGQRVVLKPVGHHFLEPLPGHLLGLFAQDVDPVALTSLPSELAPLLVQEYIQSDYELRVFVVGRQYVAFKVLKSAPSDVWERPESVLVERAPLPDGMAPRLGALCARWHLDIGGFDFLIAGNEHVFLEVNTNCDWLWFDQRAGCDDVSRAVLDYCSETLRREQR